MELSVRTKQVPIRSRRVVLALQCGSTKDLYICPFFWTCNFAKSIGLYLMHGDRLHWKTGVQHTMNLRHNEKNCLKITWLHVSSYRRTDHKYGLQFSQFRVGGLVKKRLCQWQRSKIAKSAPRKLRIQHPCIIVAKWCKAGCSHR